jgi:hypothetical protein
MPRAHHAGAFEDVQVLGDRLPRAGASGRSDLTGLFVSFVTNQEAVLESHAGSEKATLPRVRRRETRVKPLKTAWRDCL